MDASVFMELVDLIFKKMTMHTSAAVDNLDHNPMQLQQQTIHCMELH